MFHPSTPSKARARPIPPIIRFDGRAYGPGGGRRAFWNAVVLVAGAAVRHVVIESDPFAEIPPCTAMIGIVANEEGVSLEDIEVRSRSLRGEDGLAAGIDGYGNRGQVRNVRFRTGAGQFFWFEGACDLSGSTFENAGVALGEGNHVVSFNDFSSSSLILAPNSHARAHSNRFHDSPAGWPAIIIRGTPGAAADGPFIEENTIRDCLSGIICEGPGTARFRRNSIERFSGSGIYLKLGASPVFEDHNRIQAPLTPFSRLLHTERDAFPAFEETIFDSELPAVSGGYTHAQTGLYIYSAVDFGGGGRSRGNNSFGHVYSVPIADIPGGGVIKAHNNL